MRGAEVVLTVEQAEGGSETETQELSGLLSDLSIAVFITDDAGRFTFISPRVTRILGYTQSEVRDVGTIQDLFDCPAAELPQLDLDDRSDSIERSILDRRGNRRLLRVSVDHAQIAGGTRLYTCCDVTPHRVPESGSGDGAAPGVERGHDLNLLKTQFLANLNHELRTPLAAILGYAELLEDRVQGEDQEFLQLIAQSGRGLLQSLTNILDLAQLESGEYSLAFETLDLAEEVKRIILPFETYARQKGLSLRCTGMERGGIAASLDRTALERVVQALVSNAIKFTESGGVSISLERNGSHAWIRVIDTGVGIDASFLPHLFEGFRQESSGLGRDYEGHGIGLAIVKRLVDRMHGVVEVESRKDHGSSFALRFPLAPGTLSAADSAETAQAASGKADSRRRVLVVEDNVVTRRILQRMLESAYEVGTAQDPDQALDLVGKERFDALLLDINLGDRRTGVELLHIIRKLPGYRDIPAVACTAYALPGFSERLFEVGFNGYISKPFSKDMLLNAIQEAIERELTPPMPVLGSESLDLDLPPLPASLSEVVEMLSDENNADIERLTQVLSRDPVVASWVLHHVNSAFHSLRSSVTTIDRAVTMLGFEPVCNLVLSKVLTGAFTGFESGKPSLIYRHLLRLSVAAAAYARMLAEQLAMPKPELCFTVGLLHELGRLGLLSMSPDRYAALWFEEGQGDDDTPTPPPVGQELLLFGTDHVTVGVEIAREWELPKDLIYAIGRNARSEFTTPTANGSLALAVAAGAAAAERIYLKRKGPDGPVAEDDALAEILQALARQHNTTASDLYKLLRQKESDVRELVGALVQ